MESQAYFPVEGMERVSSGPDILEFADNARGHAGAGVHVLGADDDGLAENSVGADQRQDDAVGEGDDGRGFLLAARFVVRESVTDDEFFAQQCGVEIDHGVIVTQGW